MRGKNKPGRKKNWKARKRVLEIVKSHPNQRFSEIWQAAEASGVGISKSFFSKILKEYVKSGVLGRREEEVLVKSVRYRPNNKNELVTN